MAFYIKKSYADAEPGIELVNIHYTWTPLGEMPNWEAHRETRMMPRGGVLVRGMGGTTVDEAGLKGFEVDLWLGIFAPAGVPADALSKLNGALRTTLQNAEVKTALAKVGVEPRGTTVQESADILKAEFGKWKTVITEGKIKLEN